MRPRSARSAASSQAAPPIKLYERLGIGIDGVCIYATPESILTAEEVGRIVNEPDQENE